MCVMIIQTNKKSTVEVVTEGCEKNFFRCRRHTKGRSCEKRELKDLIKNQVLIYGYKESSGKWKKSIAKTQN